MDYRDLPYDAEIEYLQSTGTQWIDTEYRSDNTNAIELTVVTDGTSGFMGSNGNLQMDLTLSKGLGKRTMMVTHSKNTGPKTYVNGSLVKSQNYHTYNGYIISLFALGKSSTTVGENTRAKVYSSELRVGNITVRDFIPVRVGNVGYMYDKVSCQLFGNSGIGSFVLGPDVGPGRKANEVAFLESWGNQYIDTGIKPSTDTKIELKCLYCKSGAGLTSYGSLIGADDRNNAYILNHSAVANFTYGLEFSNNFANPQTRLLTFDSTASPQNMRVYDEGGSLVTTLTCLRGVFEVNQNLYLFATNRSGTPVYGSNRILYCKIYDGNTLVRDYVPVEYNGIGYMYDKVSGLFFDNKGTGKFLFGSIAKACARSYTRRQLMAKAPVPWKNQYLTFTALQTGTFKLTTNAVEYSLNGGSTWATLTANTNSPTVNAGETIMWRGTLSPASNVGVE